MAKLPTKQILHNWAIYRIAKKQQLVGFVTAPDEAAAIKEAVEKFEVPANVRDRLIAQRRD